MRCYLLVDMDRFKFLKCCCLCVCVCLCVRLQFKGRLVEPFRWHIQAYGFFRVLIQIYFVFIFCLFLELILVQKSMRTYRKLMYYRKSSVPIPCQYPTNSPSCCLPHRTVLLFTTIGAGEYLSNVPAEPHGIKQARLHALVGGSSKYFVSVSRVVCWGKQVTQNWKSKECQAGWTGLEDIMKSSKRSLHAFLHLRVAY